MKGDFDLIDECDFILSDEWGGYLMNGDLKIAK